MRLDFFNQAAKEAIKLSLQQNHRVNRLNISPNIVLFQRSMHFCVEKFKTCLFLYQVDIFMYTFVNFIANNGLLLVNGLAFL